MVESPSVRERRLASELRVLRQAVPLLGKDVAERLGWSASKVSRIENGRSGIGADDLELVLELYGVPPAAGRVPAPAGPRHPAEGLVDAYADTLTAGYANLIRLESGSQALRCYAAVVPHALLQSPRYVREVVLATPERPPPAEVERRVQVCLRRQEVLDAGRPGGPLELSAVVDESVLHRVALPADGGDPRAVLREQLTALLAAGERPNASIRVLPFAAGLPPVTAGSFSVLESRATGTADVVYLENKTRVFFLDGEAEVHRYGQAFDMVSAMALDPAESAARIRRALADL